MRSILLALSFMSFIACASPVDDSFTSALTTDASTADAAPPPRRKLVVIFGQSNAGSRGLVSELTDPSLALPYPNVLFMSKTGTDNNPPIYTIDPLDALGPRRGAFGIELTLGRALDAAAPGQWAIARFALGSTALAGEWWPQGTWPAGSPPNLFAQCVAYIQSALTTTNSDLAALIWIQGESDAVTVALGQRYFYELPEFVGAERTWLRSAVPFIYGELNILNPQIGAAGVRLAQANSDGTNGMHMLIQDGYPLRSDLTHYTTPGVLALGNAYASAVLAAH